MKPVKNKVFCINCGRTKQLFESESKADNFIKFNVKKYWRKVLRPLYAVITAHPMRLACHQQPYRHEH